MKKTFLTILIISVLIIVSGGVVFGYKYISSSVKVISPNGGEQWEIGKTYTIKWESKTFSPDASIDIELINTKYGPEGGEGGPEIVRTTNTGSYNWKVGVVGGLLLPGSSYKIKIYIDHGGLWEKIGFSDNTFTILPETVTPAGTEDWETYSNSNYGFGIKYPEGTKINDVDINNGREIVMDLPFSSNTTILIAKTLHMRIFNTDICNFFGESTYNVKINGIDFQKANVSGAYGGMESAAVAIEYCVVRENKAFEITSELRYDRHSDLPQFNIDEETKVFNQMLSTFKFLELE